MSTRAVPTRLATLDVGGRVENLMLDVAQMMQLDSLYAIDVCVSAIMGVAVAEQRRKEALTFAPPPGVATQEDKADEGKSKRWFGARKEKKSKGEKRGKNKGKGKMSDIEAATTGREDGDELPTLTKGLLQTLFIGFGAVVWILGVGVKVVAGMVVAGSMLAKKISDPRKLGKLGQTGGIGRARHLQVASFLLAESECSFVICFQRRAVLQRDASDWQASGFILAQHLVQQVSRTLIDKGAKIWYQATVTQAGILERFLQAEARFRSHGSRADASSAHAGCRIGYEGLSTSRDKGCIAGLGVVFGGWFLKRCGLWLQRAEAAICGQPTGTAAPADWLPLNRFNHTSDPSIIRHPTTSSMAKSHTRREEGRRKPDRRRKRRRSETGDQSSRCIERSSRDALTLDELRAARAAYFGSTPEQHRARRERLPSRMSYVADSHPRAVSSKSSSRGGTKPSDREHRRRHTTDLRRTDVRGVEETVYVYRRTKEESGSRRHSTRGPVAQVQDPSSPSRSRSSQNTQSSPRSLRRTGPTRTLNAPRDEYQEAQRRTSRAEPAPAAVTAAPPPARRIPTQHHELRYSTVPAADALRARQSAAVADPPPRMRSFTTPVEPQKPARSTSLRDNVPVMTRPSLRRSNTSARAREPPPTRPIPHIAPAAVAPVEKAPSIAPTQHTRRNSGLFSRFRPPPPPPKPPERRIECLTCLQDDIPISKSAKLSCGHRNIKSILPKIESIVQPVDAENGSSPAIFAWMLAQEGKWDDAQDVEQKSAASATANGIAVAKEAGWQRCYNCRAMVELREGCNHMTCRCTAEFCMICAARWKTCDCPWFNYNPVPDDRLYQMNIPGQPEPVQVHYRRVPGNANGLHNQPHQYAYNPRNPALNYQQEMDRRRMQERTDEQFARRLQVLGFADDDEVDVYGGGQGAGREWGIGNAGGHFMNQNYVRNAADLITAPYGQARVRGVDGGRGLAGAHIVDPAAQAAAAAAAAAALAANAPHPHVNTGANDAANAGGNSGGRRRGNSAAEPLARGVTRTRSYSERAREIFGGRRPSSRRNSAAVAAVERPTSQAGPAAATQGVGASMMAGLAMDGSRTGMGRVGTWLQHVVYDPMAVQTATAAG
ncbi:MAG: hypothetical protein Q9157_008719 [Trypethelium eluteriae]